VEFSGTARGFLTCKVPIQAFILTPVGNAKVRGYLPTLDGWRAIAVLSVVLHHDAPHSFGFLGTGWFQEHGSFGVDIFFGISGLLICSRLLEEESKYGAISLRRFYIRRGFRILPPLLGYLFVIGALAIGGVIAVDRKEWLASLLFCRNYSFLGTVPGHANWYTGHFWSLAVEEHFYFLLPGMLFLISRRWRIPSLVAVAVAVEIWRSYRLQTQPWQHLLQHTDIRLDSLLIPAILAILISKPGWHELLLKIVRFWPILFALTIALVTLDRFEVVSKLVEPILIPLFLLGTVVFPNSLAGRFLELPPLRWVGRLSYSLYLWQQLFVDGQFFAPLGIWQSAPLNWLLLFGCSAGSYYLVERPLMNMGHRFAPPATPGRSDLEESPQVSATVSDAPQTDVARRG